MRIAVELDHPVYDCLYLACADATSSVLITADHRFAKKAAETSVDVWAIGTPGVADQIETAATPPIIGGDKVEELIKASEFFMRTERHVVAGIGRRTEGPTMLSSTDVDRPALGQQVVDFLTMTEPMKRSGPWLHLAMPHVDPWMVQRDSINV